MPLPPCRPSTRARRPSALTSHPTERRRRTPAGRQPDAERLGPGTARAGIARLRTLRPRAGFDTLSRRRAGVDARGPARPTATANPDVHLAAHGPLERRRPLGLDRRADHRKQAGPLIRTHPHHQARDQLRIAIDGDGRSLGRHRRERRAGAVPGSGNRRGRLVSTVCGHASLSVTRPQTQGRRIDRLPPRLPHPGRPGGSVVSR
ncbi:conserved hypothetical protein [Frankia canadensis]|uniref:Uncharacterized protein n=1 Tax=Frankia canadensis TaxID=1836972 RepID=A0A2I2KX30_9ACTN|nr:conserved hypothetical protein [Frankia canadensis]SOU57496.1 conserved hypothetical protein [Frankia canadensis]